MDERSRREFFRGQVLLAPLTKGGNLPFRRLVTELGAGTTCGEMAVARYVVRGKRGEMALLRPAPQEDRFGAQLAGRHAEEMAQAARIAIERGAAFVDVNLGCPIDLFCRRGMGAALMKKPRKVAEIVKAMREAIDSPLSVKIRLGYDEGKPRYREIAEAAVSEGADAITLHGRARAQRYKRAADWNAVADLASRLPVPVIGNGDLLTWRDVERRLGESGCASVMLGRGALIKPWVFREIAARRDHLLGPEQRLDLLRRYRQLALDHFGDDDHGRRRVREFLYWHLDFFNRYRPIPSEEIDPDQPPLIQTRDAEPLPALDPTDWRAWLSRTDEEAREALTRLLMEEIDGDPVGAARWSRQPASAILAGS